MKKISFYTILRLFFYVMFLTNISCVTGKSGPGKPKQGSNASSEPGNSIGRGLDVSHVESMSQKLKSDINARIKNIGTCKDGTIFDLLEDKTNVITNIKKFQDIITKGLGETSLKIVPKGNCVMRSAISYSETNSGSSNMIIYYLTSTITNHRHEVVWSHKQDIKIKM